MDSGFSGFDAFDVENRVEVNNYNPDYYTDKENLKVDFVEELDKEEGSFREEDDQVPQYEPKGLPEKDPTSTISAAASWANPSELEGCLKVVSNPSLFWTFDDVVNIEFSSPFLDSPNPPTLSFIDQWTPSPGFMFQTYLLRWPTLRIKAILKLQVFSFNFF